MKQKIVNTEFSTRSIGSYDINEIGGKKMNIIIGKIWIFISYLHMEKYNIKKKWKCLDEPEFADERSRSDLNMLLLASSG